MMRSHRFSAALLALAALVPSLFAGCSAPADYRVSARHPHKDVLVLGVELDRPLDATAYERLARRELRFALASGSGREVGGVPLYAVHFEFYLAGDGEADREPVASVRYTVADPEAPLVSEVAIR